MKKIIGTKKIMFVTPYFPPHIGGVQNYVYNIAKGLYSSEGWEIVVITSDSKVKKMQIEKKDGIKIYRLPASFVFSNTPINPFWYFQIKNIIRRDKHEMKGLYYLIEVMRKIPNAKLNIIGEKIMPDEKNIFFLGVIALPNLVNQIQKSTVLVLPSLAEMEAFGMVLVEAMACKIP